jgi:hypothetical protein
VSRESLFAAFFFTAFLLLLYAFYLFVSAFFGPLLWAAILALTFYPINDWLVRRAGIRALGGDRARVPGHDRGNPARVLPGLGAGGEATGAYNRLQEALRGGAAPGIVEWIGRRTWAGYTIA